MTERFTVVPIVEGEGETAAFPILLRRLVSVIRPDLPLEIAKPIRRPRGSLVTGVPGRDQRGLWTNRLTTSSWVVGVKSS